MENAKIRENTDKLIEFVARKFEAGELDNQSLVELLQLSGGYLNFKTIAAYARAERMSYEGVRKCRRTEELFGVRFVVDNL